MRFFFRTFVIFLLSLCLLAPGAHAKIKIPGTGRIIEGAERKIAQMLGEKLGAGSPLTLDQTTAFADAGEVTDFHPKSIVMDSYEALRTPLPAGDYVIPVKAFCTQWSIHAPGQGLPYKIAPLQGRAAPAIGALLARGTAYNIAPSTLNAHAWRIQAGIPLSQWPTADRSVIHQLIPEYEKELQGDPFQQIEGQYNKVKRFPGVPSFNEMLDKMGEPGKLYKTIRRARQVLADTTLSAERLPEMLYEPTGDGLPRKLPDMTGQPPSRWSEIRPGVLARFTVLEGNLGRNRLEFRITPAAIEAKAAALKRAFNTSGGAALSLVSYGASPATGSASNPIVIGGMAGTLGLGATGLTVLEVVEGGGAIVGAVTSAPVLAVGAGVIGAGVLIAYAQDMPAQALILQLEMAWDMAKPFGAPPSWLIDYLTHQVGNQVFQNKKPDGKGENAPVASPPITDPGDESNLEPGEEPALQPDSKQPARGLPPEGVLPPGYGPDWEVGPASRPSEAEQGGKSVYDPQGGEWRYFPGDKHHHPHWDHKPSPGRGSDWENVPLKPGAPTHK